MSPELFEKDCSPTQESDRYALGMVIYEVRGCNCYDAPSFILHQVLTGLCPFHHISQFAAVVAVQRGERPARPPHAESLGFSDLLWELSLQCWDQSPSARPTAQELLHFLQGISNTWAPSLEYPASGRLSEEAGPDFTPGCGRGGVIGVLKSYLLALRTAVWRFLSFSSK